MTCTGLWEDIREFGYLGIGKVRKCINVNNECLKGSNEAIASLKLMKDVKSYELSTMDIWDILVQDSKRFNSSPDNQFLKRMLKDTTNMYYQIRCQYYNPVSKRMEDFIPITELDPVIS